MPMMSRMPTTMRESFIPSADTRMRLLKEQPRRMASAIKTAQPAISAAMMLILNTRQTAMAARKIRNDASTSTAPSYSVLRPVGTTAAKASTLPTADTAVDMSRVEETPILSNIIPPRREENMEPKEAVSVRKAWAFTASF